MLKTFVYIILHDDYTFGKDEVYVLEVRPRNRWKFPFPVYGTGLIFDLLPPSRYYN